MNKAAAKRRSARPKAPNFTPMFTDEGELDHVVCLLREQARTAHLYADRVPSDIPRSPLPELDRGLRKLLDESHLDASLLDLTKPSDLSLALSCLQLNNLQQLVIEGMLIISLYVLVDEKDAERLALLLARIYAITLEGDAGGGRAERIRIESERNDRREDGEKATAHFNFARRAAKNEYRAAIANGHRIRPGEFAKSFHAKILAAPLDYALGADQVPSRETVKVWVEKFAPTELRKPGRPRKSRPENK